MAYRFLLEVPRSMADDANAAVSASGVAQVVVVRPAHGAGFDDTYVDLTIAARNLSVIDDIYDWYEQAGFNAPGNRSMISLILHHGRQLPLSETDPPAAVAAIRRDQPWVERTIPKIGDHVRTQFASPAPVPASSTSAVAVADSAVADVAPSGIAQAQVALSEGSLVEQGATWNVVRVADLAMPERDYHHLLGMTLVGRIRVERDGSRTYLDGEYDHRNAMLTGTEATYAYMENGPMRVVLHRVGNARPLDASAVVNEFGLAVEPAMARQVKARVLMLGYTLLVEDPNGFAFRDPYGVVWNVLATS